MSPLQIQLVSDVHLEFHADGGHSFLETLPVASDVLVVAGDLSLFRHRSRVREQFTLLCRNRKRVYYVTGNHEYYKALPREVDSMIETIEKELPILRVLRPGRVEILEGRRILGATLWFRDDPMNAMYAQQLNDFDMIKKFVPWVYEQNTAALEFFEKELQKDDIVVTHHLPSSQSVHPAYAGSVLNRFFLCDVENLIRERQPALWMHGHSHSASDYYIDKCRVVCNPLGYPREGSNQTFNDRLVVEA